MLFAVSDPECRQLHSSFTRRSRRLSKAAIGFLFRSGDGAARVGGASLGLLRYVKGQRDAEPPQDMPLAAPETQQPAWPRALEETSVQVSRINLTVPQLLRGCKRWCGGSQSTKLATELPKAICDSFWFIVAFFRFSHVTCLKLEGQRLFIL